MGYWNYRIIFNDDADEPFYGLYEVTYNDQNEITSVTKDPFLTSYTAEGIPKMIQMMQSDLDKIPDTLVNSTINFAAWG